jgi:hypothetical protein
VRDSNAIKSALLLKTYIFQWLEKLKASYTFDFEVFIQAKRKKLEVKMAFHY